MLRTQLAKLGNEFVVHVGSESLPIAGSIESGWSIAAGDVLALTSSTGGRGDYRYGTLDELLFALINLSLVSDAEA